MAKAHYERDEMDSTNGQHTIYKIEKDASANGPLVYLGTRASWYSAYGAVMDGTYEEYLSNATFVVITNYAGRVQASWRVGPVPVPVRHTLTRI
jgi:hypothetical protein